MNHEDPTDALSDRPKARGLMVPLYVVVVVVAMAGWFFALLELATAAVRRLFF
jgi:hypothetical protein